MLSARSLARAARLAMDAPRQGRLPYNPRALARSQSRHMRAAVDHAYRWVPYYRELLDGLGLDPRELTRPSDLSRLPILEREEIQASPDRFRSTHLPPGEMFTLATGGTSGRPIEVQHDPDALFAGAAHRERRRRIYLRIAGKRLRLRQMTFGAPHGSTAVTAREFSRHSLIPRSVRQVDLACPMVDPIEQNVQRMERFRPDLLWGYGSYLERFFDHIEDRGGATHLPALAVYAGDGISERGLRTIPERFGTQVLGAYGAVEAFHIGFECEARLGYHVNADIYPVRIVGPDGLEAPPGETGEVVVSNLVHRGTVLLNYRLGDVARWLGGDCPCGRKLPLLSRIEGRTDDWIALPGGEQLHPQALRGVFTPEHSLVRAYQVEQRSPGDFVLRVVADPDAAGPELEALAERLPAGIRSATTDEAAVEVRFVPEITPTAAGKLRTVISLPSGAPRPVIRQARQDELGSILELMRPVNMHRLDSPEMPDLDLDRFFVCEVDGKAVGAAGWRWAERGVAKTTLLAVLPEHRSAGIGELLQRARMGAMQAEGASLVRTNADRPETIEWYCDRFGYRKVGEIPKVDEFGDPGIDRWVTLEAPLGGNGGPG